MSLWEHHRRKMIALNILKNNPSLAKAIEDVDEEGVALFGGAYICGLDHIIDTMNDSLLIDPDLYSDMRATMIRSPSIAMNN